VIGCYKFLKRLCCIAAIFAALSTPAQAHPHVYVDGRIDFVFTGDSQLQGIEVTWLYDPFETLYVLSSLEINPGADWTLSEDQFNRILAQESSWSENFNGAARLAHDGAQIALEPPVNFAVRLVGNQLEVRFTRDLSEPLQIGTEGIDVTFYEDTYYFAFTIAETPRLLGDTKACIAALNPFNADTQLAGLQTTLLELSREETPQDTSVGSLFTDRIHVSCG